MSDCLFVLKQSDLSLYCENLGHITRYRWLYGCPVKKLIFVNLPPPAMKKNNLLPIIPVVDVYKSYLPLHGLFSLEIWEYYKKEFLKL